MSDDWLQHGHEMDGVELTPVLSSSGALDGRGDAPPTPRWTSGWRGLVVGGAIALLATLGVVGVANAISDNLFPSMGSARPSSVWLNPVPPTEPAATTSTTAPASTTTTSTTPPTVPPTTEATTSSTVATTALVPSTSSSTTGDDDRGGDDEPDEPDEPDDADSSGRSGSGRDDDRDSDRDSDSDSDDD